MKPIKRDIIREAYFLPCSVCGIDFEVTNAETLHFTCWECKSKKRKDDALKQHEFLIDATIVKLEMNDTDIDEITVRITDGRHFVFTAGGYEEHYIEVDEVKETN